MATGSRAPRAQESVWQRPFLQHQFPHRLLLYIFVRCHMLDRDTVPFSPEQLIYASLIKETV